MKKFFFLAALASVALASCVKNEPAKVDSQKEISFTAPVLGASTKANVFGEMANPYSQSEHLSVYAVWHTDVFAGTWSSKSLYMDNVETAYSSSLNGWTSSAVSGGLTYYWPKNGYLTFAAYSPSDLGTGVTHSYGDTGLKITNFQVPASATQQFDVLYSERSYNKQKGSTNTNTPYDDVDLDFHHALSSIQFGVSTAQNYASSVTIKLYKISIYGVNSKGDFTEGITNEVAYANTPAWSNQDNVVLETNAYVYYDNASGLEVTNTENLLNGKANQTDLILLPQTLPATGYVKIEYGIDPAGTSTPEIKQTHTVQLSTLSATEWEPGKRYTYHVTIGLDEIYFAPEVLDWDEKTVTIPQI